MELLHPGQRSRQCMNADFAPIVDENHWMTVETSLPP